MSIFKQINMLALLCYFIYQIFIYSLKKKKKINDLQNNISIFLFQYLGILFWGAFFF